MERLEFPISAGQLGGLCGAKVIGDPDLEVLRLSPITGAEEGALTFFSDKRFLAQLDRIRRVALFTTEEWVRPELPLTYLVVEDPQKAFSGVAEHFRRRPRLSGIDPTAWIHRSAVLAPDVAVGAHARIGPGSRLSAGVSVGEFVYIGENVEIGESTILYPRVTLLDGIILGSRVTVFPGSVIGGDGFGFVPSKGDEPPREVPQVGTVRIEDDVRIGALCAIDRATIGETRIGRGTKLDNHVHVGHNVQIGRNCLICAQVGLAGSAVIGDGSLLGGQCGVSDNARLGAGVKVGAASAVFGSVDAGETIFMNPALPTKKAMPALKYFRRLPEIWDRLRTLEKRLGQGGGE